MLILIYRLNSLINESKRLFCEKQQILLFNFFFCHNARFKITFSSLSESGLESTFHSTCEKFLTKFNVHLLLLPKALGQIRSRVENWQANCTEAMKDDAEIGSGSVIRCLENKI